MWSSWASDWINQSSSVWPDLPACLSLSLPPCLSTPRSTTLSEALLAVKLNYWYFVICLCRPSFPEHSPEDEENPTVPLHSLLCVVRDKKRLIKDVEAPVFRFNWWPCYLKILDIYREIHWKVFEIFYQKLTENAL